MYLVLERLDVVVNAQVVLEFLDILGILIPRRKHAQGNFDSLGVIRVNHGRMDLC